MVLQFLAVLFERRLVGLGALLQLLLLPPAQLVVLTPAIPLSGGGLHYPANFLRYSTHRGRSSGPLTGEASMLSRPV